jgi:predicted GIY-YIG superfamily endonuclease
MTRRKVMSLSKEMAPLLFIGILIASTPSMKAGVIFHLYILQCRDNSYYVGLTNNLELRLKEHQAGRGCMYTAVRLPLKLVYTEKFKTRSSAEIREQQIKNWSRSKKQALIAGDLQLLHSLSKSKG